LPAWKRKIGDDIPLNDFFRTNRPEWVASECGCLAIVREWLDAGVCAMAEVRSSLSAPAAAGARVAEDERAGVAARAKGRNRRGDEADGISGRERGSGVSPEHSS